MKDFVFVLIGGSGFLGRNLAQLFLRKEARVVIVGRANKYVTTGAEEYYSTSQLKELTQELILKKINPIIIDLAYGSVPNTSFENPVWDFSENLSIVIKHLTFALEVKALRYIYISSGGTVYGNTEEHAINERSSNFPISPYGITKMACERYVNMYRVVHGLSTMIIRPSNVYGPGQKPFRGQGFVSTALALLFEKKPITVYGDGYITRDYLYIDNFVHAVEDVVQYGKIGEIYNIGSNLGVTINEVIDHINILGVNKLSVQRVEARPFDVNYNVLDTTKVKQLNGWFPETNLTTGITQTWEWVRNYMESR